MGHGVEAGEEVAGGGLGTERADHPARRKSPKGRRPRQVAACPYPAVAAYATAIEHFLGGGLNDRFNAMADPREEGACRYSPSHLAWLGVLLFSCHMGSREELDRQRSNEGFAAALNWLAGTTEETASCADNLAAFLERLDPLELESVCAWVTGQLIRSKALDRFRLSGRFLVVIDGTDAATFRERHCSQCVSQKTAGGGEVFKHKVLIARLVTDCGLTLCIAVEFIENPDGPYDKQDCERKAFDRIVVKIKRFFPRLPICLAGDGLFLDQGVMRTCRLNGWEYIVTFKEGSAPNLFAKAMAKVKRAGRALTEHGQDGSIRTARWAEGLVHEGNTCHAVFMDERGSDGKETTWAWCTSIRPKNADTIWETTKGGRLRWKIENETINTFVNGGYEMRHVYGGKGHALKNFFHLLQLAHAFNELVVRGDLLRKLTPKADGKGAAFRQVSMTARHFARCLLESLRNSPLWAIRTACESVGHIQIRFSSA